jgi:hypothetical protein
MELMSTTIEPRSRAAAAPRSHRTSSTAAASASASTAKRRPATAAVKASATVAPWPPTAAALTGSRFQTDSGTPAPSSRAARRLPMIPRPSSAVGVCTRPLRVRPGGPTPEGAAPVASAPALEERVVQRPRHGRGARLLYLALVRHARPPGRSLGGEDLTRSPGGVKPGTGRPASAPERPARETRRAGAGGGHHRAATPVSESSAAARQSDLARRPASSERATR